LLSRLRIARPPDLPDALILLGAATIVAGLALVSVPAAMVVGGLLVALIGLAWSRSSDGTSG
jgi:hypothetical protein